MKIKIAIFFFLTCTYSFSQVVTTISGFQGYGYYDASIGSSSFNDPIGICADAVGNLYIGDRDNHKIRKIGINGFVTTIAGSTEGYADGIGTAAQFNLPHHICIDTNGNLFVTDWSNHKIRKITPAGVVTTFAGSTIGFQNGIGTNAKFNYPVGICIDSDNNLYVADSDNQRIRKITPSGLVTTIAGGTYGIADGVGSAAQFKWPEILCLDTQNNLIVGDAASGRIRKITPDGTVTTIAGTNFGNLDGPAAQAKFGSIYGMCIDSDNNIYLSTNYQNIRKLDTLGNVTTLAGSLTGVSGTVDGVGTQALFTSPAGICIFNGTMYMTERIGRIRKITDFLNAESFSSSSFVIYPNPNQGVCTVQSESLLQDVFIYDALGRLSYSTKNINSNTLTINNTQFEKGIYIVTAISQDNTKKTQKMVVY